MIPIGKTDWNAIRTEYIGGNGSQRELAEKYGVSEAYLVKKANKEHWKQARDETIRKGIEKGQQKAAEAIADNATTAARIRAKLLAKLEKEIDALPEKIGSESSGTMIEDGKMVKGVKTRTVKSQVFKLRDLTAAYKDLTADMQMTDNSTNPLLQSLFDLERRCEGD